MTDSSHQPRFAIIIPARYESSRYPGKPLANVRGAHGGTKTLIQRTWEAATAVDGALGTWVATDDARIADAVRSFGGRVIMTSPSCLNGTERCADAIAREGIQADIIVNFQGDAPLTPAHIVKGVVDALATDPDAIMATPALRCSASTYSHLMRDQAEFRVGGTTVVANKKGHALYFSKRVLPYVPETMKGSAHNAVFLHLGVYAYRPEALEAYMGIAPSELEMLEGLEQLRFLEDGRPIRVVPFTPPGWDCIELNNPQDIPAIEAVLAARQIA